MRTLLIVLGVGVALCGLSTAGVLALGLLAADDVPSQTCSDTVRDGWAQAITPTGVTLIRGSTLVELPWPLPLDDGLRSGSLSANLWARSLGDRFEHGGLHREQFDDTYTWGPARARDGSGTVYTALTTGAQNGVAHPVVVVTSDEATFATELGGADAVRGLRALNAFPLRCAALAGKWRTSSATAAERFTAAGQFVGVEAVSHSIDLSLDETGGYTQVSTGMVNRVFSKTTETGTFTTGDWELVLTSDEGKATTYEARLIAVQGGFTLAIVDRQFSGHAYVLQR